jgi:HupE / UreJ protein
MNRDGFRVVGRSWRLLGLLGLAFPLVTLPALAHKPSDSYLTLHINGARLTGEWHLALRDLDYAVGLDANDDGAITWKELRSRENAVNAYALSRPRLGDSQHPGRIRITQMLVDNHSDGAYAVLRFVVEDLPQLSALEIHYSAFFDVDCLHRGLLRIEQNGTTRLAVFSPDSPTQRFELTKRTANRDPMVFIREGVWHIWTGYDHILFLIALLLPGVLQRRVTGWEAQAAPRSILSDVLKTVTAFTLAHSITLSLAALEIVRLPPRFVESAIAASVILAAVNNLLPLLSDRGWLVAFTFGLMHGFGFANVLADLGLRRATLAPALFGFNFGVELGQLAIVGLFLPPALLLRHRSFYHRALLPAGSGAIAVVAALWLAERVFDFKWLPF